MPNGNLRLKLLLVGCLACTGCTNLRHAFIDGLFDSAADSLSGALFGTDDCEIDPQILKRKGIEPGSKEHRRLQSELEIQKTWQERERESARQKRNEERRRMKELEAFRRVDAGLKENLDSGNPSLLPHPLEELNPSPQ